MHSPVLTSASVLIHGLEEKKIVPLARMGPELHGRMRAVE